MKSARTSISPSVLLSAAVLVAVAVQAALGMGQATKDEQARQTAAGGELKFEAASIHLEEPGKFSPPNFALDAGDGPVPPGGRSHADFPLAVYITFACKLWLTSDQIHTMPANLPKWVATDRFVINARADGNPAKDQMRLMVRGLLADRFKRKSHES